ncbi:Rho GTPase (Miro-like) [Legionella birminghamensis]|uniref:Rho GTPase (Miro-like) n=1 Tax=Legionella birminghamensis TaxID=28083 RepID=A0A378IBE4_9GAMM|nr:Rab family GTPase [Legionella birminghamensis]KTC75976.1 Rho GTPase (Miro-like) [Legionella birminghamensis]STX32102.1 Rho GTPase (Miro-like) [Legionella birminghamensis]
MLTYKIAVLGESDTGKTQLIHRLVGKAFQSQYRSSIGPDFDPYNHNERRVQLWDTPGNPKFMSLGTAFLNNTQTILYCLDVSSSNPLNVRDYQRKLDDIEELYPKAKIILVATKYDKDINEHALACFKQLANDNGFEYFLTSSKTDQGICELKASLDTAISQPDNRGKYRNIVNRLISNISRGVNRRTCGDKSSKVALLNAALEDLDDESQDFDENAFKLRIQKICEKRRHFLNFFKPHSVQEFKVMLDEKDESPLLATPQ